MNPETKLIIFAAVVVVLGCWFAYLTRGKSDLLPPPDPKSERNKPGAVP